jgi:hypothetical protein
MSDKKITITAGDITLEAELNDSETAKRIFDILPLEGQANVWGEEIYFEIPLQLAAEADARADVEVGELAYWPAGTSFCIFFGPTPVSTGDRPRAYSPVNVFGRVIGDAKQFLAVAGGTAVRVVPEPAS